MKLKYLLLAFLVCGILSCSKEDIPEPPSMTESKLTLNYSGLSQVILENITGAVTGSNYESGYTESAQIMASSPLNDITVSIFLTDNIDDIGTQALQADNTISIDQDMSTGVYATFNLTENGNTFMATSGSINLSFYDLVSPNSNIIKISGTLNVSDGTNSASGSFSDIELPCSECGG